MSVASIGAGPRIKPIYLRFGMALTIGFWLGLSVGTVSGWSPLPDRSAGVFANSASMLAYALALVLCWSIQAEYERAVWFRVAWIALGTNAALLTLRHALDTGLPAPLWVGFAGGPITGLVRHVVVLLALMALLLGLLATWLCVYRAGLGFEVLARDLIAIGVLAALLIVVWYRREQLSQAASPFTIARYAQHAVITLLCCCCAMSILLHRLSVQMGGGKLALSMTYLILATAVRFIVVCPGLFRPLHSVPVLPDLIPGSLFYSAPWFFALAAAHRRELSADAMEKVGVALHRSE